MFRTASLTIIRSFSLYTQQWYMSYSFADSLRAEQNQFRPDPAPLPHPQFGISHSLTWY